MTEELKIPVSPEMAKYLEDGWSAPVRIKIEDGELYAQQLDAEEIQREALNDWLDAKRPWRPTP